MGNISNKLLPIGSVVLLINASKPVMIYGRHQIQTKTNNVYDYIGVPYPEGNLTEDLNVFFNHKFINEVIHVGHQSSAEEALRMKIEQDISERINKFDNNAN
jgi:hypothetical protein